MSGIDTVLDQALLLGAAFKESDGIFAMRASSEELRDMLVEELPWQTSDAISVLRDFEQRVLPYCKNEASAHFMGFGDTGNDTAALAGGILALFVQQNLINQDFDSPSATFIDITVVRWLRDLVGFTNIPSAQLRNVWDTGGVVTSGGTMSNTVAMMLARERKQPGTIRNGVGNPRRFKVLVPEGIGHYSVRSAMAWIGLGDQIVSVPTDGFRYDLHALEEALRDNAGSVMSVVAYAGDSRTQTIDYLDRIEDLVRSIDTDIWLHADACWGLLCGFSESLQKKLLGISTFDSITVDPHKVMDIPYTMSALLVKDPESLKTIASFSDLIMQQDWSLGQMTPFVGSREWSSLKLWMMMRSYGRSGLQKLADQRIELVGYTYQRIMTEPRLVAIHEPDLVAVAFLYLPHDYDKSSVRVQDINRANQWIHKQMLERGEWHLHQFSIADNNCVVSDGAEIYPLRFMAINGRLTKEHIDGMLNYVLALGKEFESMERKS
ncbi:pyridoxal phosphate-dependent decarboxylase family protein [Paenarthrobacter sp. NPDC089989]